jgi:molybdate transport system substrate-binding protein
MRDAGRFWRVPLDSYPPIEQGGVILKWAADRRAAEQLRDFLTGPDGRRILERYGFRLP